MGGLTVAVVRGFAQVLGLALVLCGPAPTHAGGHLPANWRPGGSVLDTVRIGRGAGPELSPDGQRVAYRTGDAIRVYDLRTRSSRQIYETDDGYDLRWSPNGRLLAFHGHGQNSGSPRYSIWVVDAQGGEARNIGSSHFDRKCPVWSPSGKALAWSEQDAIWVSDLSGRNPHCVVRPGVGESLAPIDWNRRTGELLYRVYFHQGAPPRYELVRCDDQGHTRGGSRSSQDAPQAEPRLSSDGAFAYSFGTEFLTIRSLRSGESVRFSFPLYNFSGRGTLDARHGYAVTETGRPPGYEILWLLLFSARREK